MTSIHALAGNAADKITAQAEREASRILAELAVDHATGADVELVRKSALIVGAVARMSDEFESGEDQRLAKAIDKAIAGSNLRQSFLLKAGFTKKDLEYNFFADYVERREASRMRCAFLIGMAAGARIGGKR